MFTGRLSWRAEPGGGKTMILADKIIRLRKRNGWSQEELAEKTARLKELNILLNMDEKDKTLLDDTPDEGEDVPARRVAELAR